MLKRALLLLPLLCALAVLFDTPFHRLSKGELTGVVRGVSRPSFSIAEAWSGELQSQYEQWFEQELSFRPEMVRTANTLNFSVFHELVASSGQPVIYGADNTLFEMFAIDDANGVSRQKRDLPLPSPYTVEESARRMGDAARLLRARKIPIVLLLYPTKAWMELGLLPHRFRLPGGKQRSLEGYQHLLSELRANDVPVIDGVEVLTQLHESNPTLPLYNRGGMHWTAAAACSVAQRIVEEMVGELSEGKRPIKSRLSCPLGPTGPAHGGDVDLAELSNLWNIDRFRDPIPTVEPRLSRRLPGGPRTTLVIGTSFSLHLIWALRGAGVIDPVQRMSYYRHGDADSVHWENAATGRGFVLIEQSQSSFLTINSSEFADDLLTRLGAAPVSPSGTPP